MGCFLACFGYSKKRKRLKTSNRVRPRDQRHGSYEPLDSSVYIKLDITEKSPIASDSEFRDKPEEPTSFKIRKKVSFNLNVRTYEPIPAEDNTNDEEEEEEKNNEETRRAKLSEMGSYPSNYRYQNCRDSYDEEDEIILEESDLDDDEDEDEDDDDEGDGDFDNQNITPEEFSGRFYALSMESQKGASSSPVGELKMPALNQNAARDRRQYVHSVLNPVENLTQWKAVKTRAIPPLKHQRKENIAFEQELLIASTSKPSFNTPSFSFAPNFNQSKPLLQDFAVDVSLSNWLNSSETAPSVTKRCSTIAAAATIPLKNNTRDRSNSLVNTEHRLI